MVPRAVFALLLLRAALGTEEEALLSDDECAEGSCSNYALQRGAERLHEWGKQGTEAQPEELEAKPDSDDALALIVQNNASNEVLLVNCLERYSLAPGQELATTLTALGGFFVAPVGTEFNCSLGCSDCFYFAQQWSADKGASVRLGFGVDEDDEAHPSGGGIEMEVSKVGVTGCSDASCPAGWDKPLPLDLSSSTVTVAIQGSELAKPTEEDLGSAAPHHHHHRAHAKRRGGYHHIRRPIHRRPIHRPRPIHHRPVYRPIRRRPIVHRPVGPRCYFCSQYGFGTCWWLCR